MITLSYLATIHFTGADAGNFLHNQVSADILGLKSGESSLACYCEPKGRVLSLMLISCQKDGYIVILSKALQEAMVKRLQMYVLRSKVEIDTLEGYGVAGIRDDVQGDDESKPKSQVGPNTLPPNPPFASLRLPESNRTYIVAESDSLPDAETDNQGAWKQAELKTGISWLGTDTSGEFLPQFLGFDQIGAVNYRKGCYPGQEIVARTHYLGKVKRHPRLICSNALIGPNQMEKVHIVSAGESYEAVTVDYAFSETEGNCLMVVTRMDPELHAEEVEYQGQTVDLVQA